MSDLHPQNRKENNQEEMIQDEQVQNPELVPKMRAGVQDIEAELAHSQDLLAEATDAMAKETEEEEYITELLKQ